jgi:hypothetical protein
MNDTFTVRYMDVQNNGGAVNQQQRNTLETASRPVHRVTSLLSRHALKYMVDQGPQAIRALHGCTTSSRRLTYTTIVW